MTTIVSLHAHPDDEALLTGGWLARRAAAGDRVVLVFATDGGAGLTAAGRATARLGDCRRREAAASARALGASRVVWLGHADSGTVDAPSAGPGRLVDTDLDEVVRAVVGVLDEEDATILTGYDANGGYGHPDHRRVHRVARVAQGRAVRRPVLLEATLDRTWLQRWTRLARPLARLLPGLTIPGRDVFSPRPEITHVVDVRAYVEDKRRALAAHASQAGGGVRIVAILTALPRPVARRVLGTEWFVEVR